MMDIILNNDQNLIATTLMNSINASHFDALPTSSNNIDVSQAQNADDDPDEDPPLKETARALRAKKNLTTATKRPLHRHRHHSPSPSDSSLSDSEGHSDGNENSHNKRHDEGVPNRSSKETTQPSGSRNPNSLTKATKRHRSSSPIHRKKLGSMENPIDVDSIASLFEPMVIKEYVCIFFFRFAYAEYTLQLKKETISLSLEMNPPIIKGDKSYTVFDVEGNSELFTPSFHVSPIFFFG